MTVAEYVEQAAALIGVPVENIEFLCRNYNSGRFVHCYDIADAIKGEGMTYFTLRMKDNTKLFRGITSFALGELPGCCAFMLSTGSHVWEPYRRKGLQSLSNKFRQAVAKQWGYTAMICTDISGNIPQRKVLAKEGWQDVYSIRNRRTDNIVNISIKEIDYND